MGKKIKVSELSVEIRKALNEYSTVTKESLKKSVSMAAKEAREEIEEKAPKKTGEYAKSWKVRNGEETGQSVSRIVYADKPHYRMAHLLEKPHARRGGGRMVPAKPHIAQAEEKAIKRLEELVKKEIGK